MIPTSFDYVRAGSLREALAALAAGGGTKVIAGGHSLLPIMKFRLAQPARLVDIAHLPDLKGITEHRRGTRLGAMTTYRDVLDSAMLGDRFPILAECCRQVADLQVRNRGTIGGSLAHADPASDMPAVMLALDATFTLRSKRGKRAVPAREFFLDAFTTALAEDELLTEITLPPLPKGAGTCYTSITQAASGYAIVGAAAVVAASRQTISRAVVALTGLRDVAYVVPGTDRLTGTRGEPELLDTVANAALEGVDVQGDIHAPAEYRRHLGAVVVRRALERALERAK